MTFKIIPIQVKITKNGLSDRNENYMTEKIRQIMIDKFIHSQKNNNEEIIKNRNVC